jgi:hypothetical protein
MQLLRRQDHGRRPPDRSAADWISPMRGGELAAGEERDRCRKEIVGETTVEERNREGNVRRTVGEEKDGLARSRGSRRGGAATGWAVAVRRGDARETDAGGG